VGSFEWVLFPLIFLATFEVLPVDSPTFALVDWTHIVASVLLLCLPRESSYRPGVFQIYKRESAQPFFETQSLLESCLSLA
jgi:hypothetical protein